MNILYVENDPRDAELAMMQLLKAAPHFQLEIVTTLSEASARLERLETGPLDLLLTEVRLPDGDGLALVAQIRARALPLAAVVITGTGDEGTAVAALKAGADDYVTKRKDYLERLPLVLESAFRHYRDRERALRESEERNRAILNAIPDLMFLQDKEGVFLDYHAKDASDLLVAPEQFLGKKMTDVLPPDLAAALKRCFERALETGETQVHEYSLRVKGESLWFEALIARTDGEKLLSVVRDITERTRHEEAVSFQAHLLNTIEQAVIATDMAGAVIFWNQFAERLYGWSMDEAMGRKVKELLRPTDLQERAEEIWANLRAGKSWAGEFTVKHRDGTLLQIWFSDSPIYDTRGNMIGVLGISHDITERKQAEEALRRSEERLRLAQQAARVGTWEWDVRTGEAIRSEMIWQLLGLEPGDGTVTADSFTEFIHPEDRDRALRKVYEVVAEGNEYYDEFRIVRRDGRVLWLSSKGCLIRAADGRAERILGVNIDITERKLTEEALKESEQRFRMMADAAPIMIWMSGTDKLCTYFNKNWLDFRGRTMEEELGNGWCEGVHPADHDRCLETYSTAFDARRPFTMEYRLLRHGRQYRWVLDKGVPHHSPDSTFLGYIGSAFDITERKLAEEALKQSEDQVRVFVEHTPAAVAMFDREMRYMLMSRRWLKDNKIEEQDIIGRSHYEVVPDIPERWKEGHRRCLAGEVQRCEEDVFQHSDGSSDWVRWETRPWYTASGEVGGIIMFSETITERKRSEDELLRLTVRLFTLQDEERRRIARELHDVTAQNLFAISINLTKLHQSGSTLGAEQQRVLEECRALTEQSLQEIRTLSYLLHPPLLDQAGLVSALRWYVEGFTEHSGVKVQLLTPLPIERLPSEVETALFRIVQEGLRSIRRHSGSSAASISLERRGHEVVLQIKGQGRRLLIEGVSAPEEFRLVGVGIGVTAHCRDEGRELAPRAGCDECVPKPLDEGALDSILSRYLRAQ
ncbi:MAG TPA: PAS domain S-box protein [Pyrinomonadaceae bacterium]|nr:PAS domain S-box protein [Pyrinomonadaceae bacterium]